MAMAHHGIFDYFKNASFMMSVLLFGLSFSAQGAITSDLDNRGEKIVVRALDWNRTT